MQKFFDRLVELSGSDKCCFIQEMWEQSKEILRLPEKVERLSAELLFSGSHKLKSFKQLAIFNPSQKLSLSNQPTFTINMILRLSEHIADNGCIILGCSKKGISNDTRNTLEKLGWFVRSYIPRQYILGDDNSQDWIVLFREATTDGKLFIPSIEYFKERPELCADLLISGNSELWRAHKCISARDDFKGYSIEQCRRKIEGILENAIGVKFVQLSEILELRGSDQQNTNSAFVFRLDRFLTHEYEIIVEDITDTYSLYETESIISPKEATKIDFKVSKKIIADYLEYFFETELGKSVMGASGYHRTDVLDEANNGIFEVDINSLLLEKIPFPEVEIMREIISARQNLTLLKSQISRLENKLILRPNEIEVVNSDVLNLLSSIKLLTAADEIKSLVRSGESKTIEFKETLSWDVRLSEKSKKIELSALKTISGFLNSNGGTLLIGIADSGEIIGTQHEIDTLYRGIIDRYVLHLKNLLNDKITLEFLPFLEWYMVPVGDVKVLRVDVRPASKPSFIDDVFYVRTNPATDQLKGQKLADYLKERFPS
jgi:hypothetical protein